MVQRQHYDYCRRYRLDEREVLYGVRLTEVDGAWRVEAHRLGASDCDAVTGEVGAWEFGSKEAAKDFVDCFLDEKHGAPGENVDGDWPRFGTGYFSRQAKPGSDE